ncbi:MAG: hypothetical protein NVS3B10_24220 [Polyangiales bacterium]
MRFVRSFVFIPFVLASAGVLAGCGSGVTFPDSADADPDAAATPGRVDAASGTITVDGGSSSTAGPGGTPTTVACGSASCIIPTESCCVYESTSPPSYACVAGPSCPPLAGGGKGTALRCSAAANCAAGLVCCVTDGGGHPSSDCKAACAKNEAQLCDPAATPTGCAPGVSCSANNVTDWGIPNTYATCGGVGN